MSEASKNSEEYIPNFAIGRQEASGMLFSKANYYPEEIEKMKNMSIDERRKYVNMLIKSGRHF